MSDSMLTPQAPLDLGRLEKQAKEAGTKYVANLLQVTSSAKYVANLLQVTNQIRGQPPPGNKPNTWPTSSR